MAEQSGLTVARLIVDLLLQALRVRDERLNALGRELVGGLGSRVVRTIVLAACDRRNSVAHRVRLLGALAGNGVELDPESIMDLTVLLRSKSHRIREAVWSVLFGCRST